MCEDIMFMHDISQIIINLAIKLMFYPDNFKTGRFNIQNAPKGTENRQINQHLSMFMNHIFCL